MSMVFPRRGDIFWVSLDPTLGSEVNKTRPGVVVSNDEANEVSSRVIIAPITSSAKRVLPFEVAIKLGSKKGKVMLDQIRSIDKKRLGKLITTCDGDTIDAIDDALQIALGLMYG